jgi:hypothetical protein
MIRPLVDPTTTKIGYRRHLMDGATTSSPTAAHHAPCGHTVVQNLRRGHHEINVDVPAHARVRVAFTGTRALPMTTSPARLRRSSRPIIATEPLRRRRHWS